MNDKKGLLKRLAGVAAVLLIAGFLAGCLKDDDDAGGDPNQTAVEQFTTTTILRDESSGEYSRDIKTDSKQHVREIDIAYRKDQSYTHGVIQKDAAGKITGLEMILRDLTLVSGRLGGDDGKTLIQGVHKRSNGNLIVTVEPKGKDTQVTTVYATDGKTVQAVGTHTPGTTTWQTMRSDGTTVWSEMVYDNVGRASIKLFDENGKLLYQDGRAPNTQSWTQSYIGTVFDKQGHPRFRITMDESTWNNSGTMKKIEEFDTDGVTVKTSTDIPYWNAPSINLGVFANQQELLNLKQQQQRPVTAGIGDVTTMQTALAALLKE